MADFLFPADDTNTPERRYQYGLERFFRLMQDKETAERLSLNSDNHEQED